MKTRAIVFSLVTFGTFVWSLTLTPAFAAERIALQGGPDMPGARGEAVIGDVGAGQKEVIITAEELKPNEVYTVWLVKMEPKMDMTGLGAGDYSFDSDGNGKGRYAATVSGATLEKWQLIEIAHHPDRNPRNMKKMGIALKGALK